MQCKRMMSRAMVIDGDDSGDDVMEDEYDSKDDEFDIDDYMQDDEIPSYKTSTNNQSADDEHREIPYAPDLSFQDMLQAQLGLRILTEDQNTIAETIIGNLDDSGYLQRDISAMVDDLAFSQNINVSDDDILEVLQMVQEFDPAGIGARNLQECLLIQLRRKQEFDLPSIDLAILILENYFNEFVKKHYDKIMKKARINEDELKDALSEVLKLNPKPGNSLSETTKTNHYVIPDFIIQNTNGELELTLNSTQYA